MGRYTIEKRRHGVLDLMRRKFPLGRLPSAEQKEAFKKYDERQKKKIKRTLEKAEERDELINLVQIVSKYGKRVEKPDFWFLEHKDLSLVQQVFAFFKDATIQIPNPCANLIAQGEIFKGMETLYKGQLNLFNCTAEEQVRYYADICEYYTTTTTSVVEKPEFLFVWYDTCGYCQEEQYQTIEILTRLHIMRRSGPSIFAVTFTHRDNNQKTGIRHNFAKRYLVDDWVVQCFVAQGYQAHKTSRLSFPRVKKSVYTWVYIVIPPGWTRTLEEFNAMDQEINQYLEKYPTRSGEYPIVSVECYESKPIQKDQERLWCMTRNNMLGKYHNFKCPGVLSAQKRGLKRKFITQEDCVKLYPCGFCFPK